MTRRSAGRGLVESTQWAVLMPLLLATLLAVVQAGLWFAGRSTVQQAAMAGAEHAAFAGTGTRPEQAGSEARQVATQMAERGGLIGVDVQVVAIGATVEVSTSGRVPTVLPGDWSLVQATARRMREE